MSRRLASPLGLAVLAAIVAIASIPATRGDEAPRGSILAIGGGKLTDDLASRVVALAHADEGRTLVVCPAASEQVEGPEVERFRARGAKDVVTVDFRTRADADSPERAATLERAGGIFFTGGDQKRLLSVLEGSKALAAIRAAWRSGAVIAGTSAGCAALGEVAILGDGEPETIRPGATPLGAGLGFVAGAILDQHFLARRRHNRLVSALLEKKSLVGLGIDERTAIQRVGLGPLEVVGESFVSVYLPAKEGRGFELRLLAAGEKLELAGRR